MATSLTSRFVNVLFANVLIRFASVPGQFPNELYTDALDFYVS